MKRIPYLNYAILCILIVLNGNTIANNISNGLINTATNLQGEGTESSPYEIATFEDLDYLSRTPTIWDKYFVLTSDIDASQTSEANSQFNNNGAGFSPIGDDPIYGKRQAVAFTGSFDGQNYSISNLYIYRDDDFIGLFGYIADGLIQNLFLIDFDITAGISTSADYSGVLSGYTSSSNETYEAPYTISTTIKQCYSSGNIKGKEQVGGLIGGAYYTLIENSYSTATVEGNSGIGGLVGDLEYGSQVSNCYASGLVTGDESVGGLTGYFYESKVEHSYWDAITSTQNYSSAGEALNTVQFADEQNFPDWDFSTTWKIASVANDPYIRPRLSGQQLETNSLIACFTVNSCIGTAPFEVTFTDVSTGSPTGWNWDFGDNTTSTEQNPTHTYTATGVYEVNLIISTSTLKDTLTVTECITVLPFNGSGTLEYPFEIATIEDLHFLSQHPMLWDDNYILILDIDASLTSDQASEYNNGGLGFSPIGDSYDDGTRQKVPFTGSFNGNKHHITNLSIFREENYLGLFGFTENATILNLSLQQVTINNSFNSQYNAGALIGYSTYSNISECFSSGIINAYSRTGGLIGYSRADTILNSYSVASVNSYSYAGGLTGYLYQSVVSNSYSSGAVSGTSRLGALAGYSISETISSSFWDNQTSNQSVSDGGTELSTPEFSNQNSFSGWDFNETWQIAAISEDKNLRPRFQWQETDNSSLVASYDLSPKLGKVPLEVTFTDKSNGTPSSWLWDFGDGNSSAEQNPVHIYDSLGTFNVSLVIDNGTLKDTIIGQGVISTHLVEGEGTAANPIKISNLADLHYVSENTSLWDKYFVLTADIDADSTSISGSVYNNEGKGFSPIGDATNGSRQQIRFTGNFNGQGYCIKNLYINRTDSHVGLFGYTNEASIKNLGIEYANITTTLDYAGILIGSANLTTINNCFTQGNISADDVTGGLVGYAIRDSVIDSYTTANVAGDFNIGGLIGSIVYDGFIKNCYSSGQVTANTGGGLVSGNSGGTFENCYWDSQTSILSSSGAGEALTTSQFADNTNFVNWDFVSTWRSGIITSDEYVRPRLQWQELVDSSSTLLASFSFSPQFGAAPLEISFTDASVGNITTWEWDFGDGSNSSEQNPTHTYNTTGIYDVNLIVSDGTDKDTVFVQECVKVYLFPGEGTAENPFEIDNLNELHFVSQSPDLWDKHFILTADIDADSTSITESVYNNSGMGFSPIGDASSGARQQIAFTGSFNGKGNSISNLHINRDEDYLGLFGYAENALIDSILLNNIQINSSGSKIGALIGYDTQSAIQYCNSRGDINGEDNMGGLIGYAHQDTISYCYSFANLTGDDYMGGLTGYEHAGVITNCYAGGTVNGDNIVGGLVGFQYWGTIINSYSSGEVVANTKGGGLTGLGQSESTQNSYWDVHTTTQIPSYSGEYLTTTQFTDELNFYDWDFTNTWKIGTTAEDKNIRPRLQWQETDNSSLIAGFLADTISGSFPLEVTFTDKSLGSPDSWFWNFGDGSTSTEQNPVHNFLSSGYFDVMLVVGKSGFANDTVILNKCITVFPFTGEGTVNNPFQLATLADLHFLSEYTPIWDQNFVLLADIDADSTSIEGCKYNNNGQGFSPIGYEPEDFNPRNQTSFRGSFNGQNHTISNLFINRNKNSLGLFGYIEGAFIDSLKVVDAQINDSLLLTDNLALLVGQSSQSQITFCSVSGKLAGDDNIGGLIGRSDDDVIKSCTSAVTVSGDQCIGSLIGYKYDGYTEKCFTSGEVTGSQYVGGFIGRQYSGGIIKNSYSISPVQGDRIIGGFAGHAYESTILNCYSSGEIKLTEDDNNGGFIGLVSDCDIQSCYWDTQTSDYPISAAGEGLTTYQFQTESNFTNWDFEEIWKIGEITEDTYFRPRLNIQDIKDERSDAIYSVTPSRSLWTDINDSIVIFAYPVTPTTEVLLQSETYGFWEPDSIKYIDSLNIKAYLSFSLDYTGMFDVLLINESDTIRRKYCYSVLNEETPFNEWMNFKELKSDIYSSFVHLPEADEIFCIIKKRTHIGYDDTWNGKINIYTVDRNKIGESHYSGSDIIFTLKDIKEGYYPYEILSGLDSPWDGQIKFCLQPDQAEFNNWNTGEILRPYGHDWKYFIVPENTDTLFLRSEGYGMWSTIYVVQDSIDSDSSWSFKNWGNGYTIQGIIPNPKPGIYYVRYMDSAVLYDSEMAMTFWKSGGYAKDQTRQYMLYVGGTQSSSNSPMPLSITSLSAYEVGQGAVSITIEGTGFTENSVACLSKGEMVYQAEITNYNSNNIEAFFNLFDADTGSYNLIVKDLIKDEETSSPRNVDIVKSDLQEEDIDIQVLSRTKLRQGRWQTVIVEVTNKSLTDQIMIPLTISIPTTCEFELPTITNLDDVEILDSTISMSDVSVYSIVNDVAVIPYFLRYLKAGESYRFEFKIMSENQEDFNINFEVESPFLHLSNELLKSAFMSTSGCYSTCADEAMALMIDITKKVLGVDDIASCISDIGGIFASLGYDYSKGRSLDTNADILTAVRQYALSTGSAVLSCLEAAGKSIPLANAISFAYDCMGYADHMIAISNCYETCLNDDNPEPKKREKKKVELPIEMTYSTTPEDKYGPIGATVAINDSVSTHFIDTTQQQFEYRIDYWNKEDAPAPAAIVYIKDTLDTDFNIASFSFTEIGFLKWKLELEGGPYFNVNIDCRPDMPYIVNVEGTVGIESREVNWTFTTLDPETMALSEDPLAGFLPPIDSTGYQVGWANFTIWSNDSLPNGTEFSNQAHVNFDGVGVWGPAPKEGPYTNIFDFEPPVSEVKNDLPAICQVDSVKVNWSGTDMGSGINNYTIYADNGTEVYEWLSNTSDTSAYFKGEMGKNYTFYSIATDNVGNIEPNKTVYEASVLFNSDTLILSGSGITIGYEEYSDSVQVRTLDNYTWSATSDCDWLTITSGASGSGTANVYFTIDANTEHLSRSCNINIDDLIFTVNQECLPDTSLLSEIICEGEVVTVGDSVYNETGEFSTIFQNQYGCDSIVILNLTVHPVNRITINETLCEGESYIMNGNSYNQSGIYIDTLINNFSCDSIVTLNLIVNQKDSVSISETICEGEYVIVGDSSYNETGIFVTVLQNQYMCDSVVRLDLNVNEKSSTVLNETICPGETFIMGGKQYGSSGTFTTTLSNKNGCDSIVILDLTVNQIDSVFIIDTIWQGESYLFNEVSYTQSGIYTTVLTNKMNCDSVVTLQLHVKSHQSPYILNPIDDINIHADDTISASYNMTEVFAQTENLELFYRYLLDGDTLPLWITPIFMDSILTLNFTPELIDTGCYIFSINAALNSGPNVTDSFQICVVKNLVGTEHISIDDLKVNIYPNPTKDKVILEIEGAEGDLELTLFNLIGEQILRNTYQSPVEQIELNLSDRTNGVYLVCLKIDKSYVIKKVILNK